mmetsp:Transcript_106295/g.317643  ORF Transcript_106295/g.317643 Transcript_106295/m.317643 type:complete len:207 (+) Transcript_106295:1293-1913(+)
MAPLEEECAEGQSLRRAPVEALAGFDALPLVLHDALQAVVELEALRNIAEPHSDLLEQVDVRARWQLLGELVRHAHALPLRGDPLGARCGGRVGLSSRVVLLELIPDSLPYLTQGGRLGDALADEALLKDVNAALVLADRLVEQWLGELWVIALVVPEAPVADHVEDDIVAPLLPPLCGHLECTDHRNGVISVDVENGHAKCLAQV